MPKSSKKGFAIILVLSMITIFLLTTVTIVAMSCNEAIQTKINNDDISAYYIAVAGAERMYARLKYMQAQSQTVTWPLQPTDLANVAVQLSGSTVGTFTVTASLTGASQEFAIISKGTVKGRTSTVTVKYGYSSTYTNGVPMGSIGSMSYAGSRWWFLTSRVYVDGPVESASSISPSQSYPNTSPYVQYYGEVNQNKSDLNKPSFWYKYDSASGSWTQKQVYDTNGDGSYLSDTTNKGYVDISDAGGSEANIAIFNADNINGDDRIDTKDAFISYYTVELNNAYNLGINPGGANYYSGDISLGPYTVPAGTSIIFVNGDANILFNAQQWWGATADFTVVSTGDITIVQPVNGSDDRMSLVALGNISTGGINLGEIADVDGNLNMYSEGSFTAILGGSTNGSIMTGGTVNVQTGLPSFLFNRDFNQGTDDWSDPANRPRGLPPGYPEVSRPFSIKAENYSSGGYKPRWQQR